MALRPHSEFVGYSPRKEDAMKRHLTESERMAQAVLSSLYKGDLIRSAVFGDVEETSVAYGQWEPEWNRFLRRLERTLTFFQRRLVDPVVRIHLSGIQIKDSPKDKRELSYWRVETVEVWRRGEFRGEDFFLPFEDQEKVGFLGKGFDLLLGSYLGTTSYGTFYQVR